MNPVATMPQTATLVNKIHKFLKLHANAFLTTNFCAGFRSVLMTMTLAAAALPESWSVILLGRPEARS